MENEGNHGDHNFDNINYKVHNGYSYTVNKTMRDGTKYLCCKEKNTAFCKGTAKVTPDGVVEQMQIHCHVQDEHAEEVLMFRTELKRAVETRGGFLKDIYDTTRLLYPIAATRLPYVTAEPSMRRWRAVASPPTPTTLAEWAEILQDETWRHRLSYNGGALSVYIVRTGTDENASVSVVFGNSDFIRQLQAEGLILIDATFKVVPRDVGGYQLLTMMIIQHNHAIPFAWALMDRKTQSAYRGVLDTIKTELAPHLRPLSVMCDYERALRNEVAAAFPDAQILGCYFHYCQALQKKAKKLGVRRAVANNVDGRDLLKNYMSLALLPAAHIEENAHSIYGAASPDVQRIFQTFKVYYERQWLRREKPESFSVYGQIRRTNNCVESFNNRLLSKLGSRPTIWHFTAKMTELQANVHADLETLRTGRPVTRTPKLRYLISDARIRRAWREFEDGVINAVEFLERARSEIDLVDRNMEHRLTLDDAAGINLDVSDEDNEEENGEQDVIANRDDRPETNDPANDLQDDIDEQREVDHHWDFLEPNTNEAERTLDDHDTSDNNIVPSPNRRVRHDSAESLDGVYGLDAAENLNVTENRHIIENLEDPRNNDNMHEEPIVPVRSPLPMAEDSDNDVVEIDEASGAEAPESAATTPAPTAAGVDEAHITSSRSKKRNRRRKKRNALKRAQASQMGGLYGLPIAGPSGNQVAGPSGLQMASPSGYQVAGRGSRLSDRRTHPYRHKRRKRHAHIAAPERTRTGEVQIPELQRTEAPICAICYDKPAGYRFIPCGHDVFCDDCALQLFCEDSHLCPLCRTTIEEYTRTVP